MPGDGELAEITQHFRVAAAEVYRTSPLYQRLCLAVADDRNSLELLRHRRPGQQPSYLLFGAVHYLLLSGVDHPLAAYYPSLTVTGPAGSDPGPPFLDFVRRYRDRLLPLVTNRLVQTNVIRRSVGLRYALSVVAAARPGPVHLIEVGASAGLQLRLDRYRFAFGTYLDGPSDAAITIRTRWGDGRDRPLNQLPRFASQTGIDLNPIDVTDPDQRLWLRALVWPESTADAGLLQAALIQAAAHPVNLVAGDAIDVCPRLARTLPPGETRVVFHTATRMHVPADRRAAFDNAIDGLGRDGPLYHVWQEPPTAQHHGVAISSQAGLFLHADDPARTVPLAEIDGHGAWITPYEHSADA